MNTAPPITYGVGYGGARYTPAQALTLPTVAGLAPEFARRMFAAMDGARAAGLDLVIGTAYRSDAQQAVTFMARHVPDPQGPIVCQGRRYRLLPGMAPAACPGSSFHGKLTVFGGAVAVDWVWNSPGFAWLEAHRADYGLTSGRLWSKSEPWHWQPSELPSSFSTWVKAGPKVLDTWKLPAGPALPPPAIGPDTPNKPTIREGSTGSIVTYAQLVLTQCGAQPGPVDGRFGRQTTGATMAFQRAAQLAADGIIGPRTWAKLDAWQLYFEGRGGRPS